MMYGCLAWNDDIIRRFSNYTSHAFSVSIVINDETIHTRHTWFSISTRCAVSQGIEIQHGWVNLEYRLVWDLHDITTFANMKYITYYYFLVTLKDIINVNTNMRYLLVRCFGTGDSNDIPGILSNRLCSTNISQKYLYIYTICTIMSCCRAGMFFLLLYQSTQYVYSLQQF